MLRGWYTAMLDSYKAYNAVLDSCEAHGIMSKADMMDSWASRFEAMGDKKKCQPASG